MDILITECIRPSRLPLNEYVPLPIGSHSRSFRSISFVRTKNLSAYSFPALTCLARYASSAPELISYGCFAVPTPALNLSATVPSHMSG